MFLVLGANLLVVIISLVILEALVCLVRKYRPTSSEQNLERFSKGLKYIRESYFKRIAWDILILYQENWLRCLIIFWGTLLLVYVYSTLVLNDDDIRNRKGWSLTVILVFSAIATAIHFFAKIFRGHDSAPRLTKDAGRSHFLY